MITTQVKLFLSNWIKPILTGTGLVFIATAVFGGLGLWAGLGYIGGSLIAIAIMINHEDNQQRR